MKNAVTWNVTPCGSCKNRRFGESYRHHQDERIGELGTLAVTTNRSALRYVDSYKLTRHTHPRRRNSTCKDKIKISLCYVQKQTPWPLVRKRTIPTERPLLLGEI
jgi:hypothetical protein